MVRCSEYPQILQIEIPVSLWELLANNMMMDGAIPPSPVKVLYGENFSTTSLVFQL